MDIDVIIEYNGDRVSGPKEVADFLEEDRRRMAAQERRDKRHLSRSGFEQLSFLHTGRRDFEDDAIRNLQLESLRRVVIASVPEIVN